MIEIHVYWPTFLGMAKTKKAVHENVRGVVAHKKWFIIIIYKPTITGPGTAVTTPNTVNYSVSHLHMRCGRAFGILAILFPIVWTVHINIFIVVNFIINIIFS